MNFRFVNILGWLIVYWLSAIFTQVNATMNISIVSEGPVIQWYQRYITKTYTSLGQRVVFKEYPTGRGAVEANKGVIDALTIRSSTVESLFPEFIRVPVALAQGSLVLYCQLELQCDESIVNNSDITIGVISGVNLTRHFMKNKNANLYEVKNGLTVAEMFLKRRLSYILTIETPSVGNYVAIPKHTHLSAKLLGFEAFHYIHKKHEDKLLEIQTALELAIQEIGPIPKNYLETVVLY